MILTAIALQRKSSAHWKLEQATCLVRDARRGRKQSRIVHGCARRAAPAGTFTQATYRVSFGVFDNLVVTQVPEPSTLALLLGGIGLLVVVRCQRASACGRR
jgi:hypothetical protein